MARSNKLEDAVKEYDAWKRATDLVKQEKGDLEKEPKTIKEEFALDSRPDICMHLDSTHSSQKNAPIDSR